MTVQEEYDFHKRTTRSFLDGKEDSFPSALWCTYFLHKLLRHTYHMSKAGTLDSWNEVENRVSALREVCVAYSLSAAYLRVSHVPRMCAYGPHLRAAAGKGLRPERGLSAWEVLRLCALQVFRH